MGKSAVPTRLRGADSCMEVLSVIDSHLGYLLPRAGMARLTRHKSMRGTVSHPFGKQAGTILHTEVATGPRLPAYKPLACTRVLSDIQRITDEAVPHQCADSISINYPTSSQYLSTNIFLLPLSTINYLIFYSTPAYRKVTHCNYISNAYQE